jgi:hypothetical protein
MKVWVGIPGTKTGQERRRVVFALFPHRCADGYVRWLCYVTAVERWYFVAGWCRSYYEGIAE